jgi:hypothetical protein
MKFSSVVLGVAVSTFVGFAAVAGSVANQPLGTPLNFGGTPEISEEVVAQFANDPAKSLMLVSRAFDVLAARQASVDSAILQYFGLRLAKLKHAVWVGDVSLPDTAFAFVDYSSPFVGEYLGAVEDFAKKRHARVIVLPGYVDPAQRPAAVQAAAIAAGGKFVSFFGAVREKGRSYSGAPVDLLVDQDRPAILSLEDDDGVVEQVELVHLVLLSKHLAQPMALVMEGRMFIGNLTDGDEMAAFFAPLPSFSDAGHAASAPADSSVTRSTQGKDDK